MLINIPVLILAVVFLSFDKPTLKTNQLKYPRVKAAYSTKWRKLADDLSAAKVDNKDFDLYIRVFKREKILEAWAKNSHHSEFTLVKTFPVCASSGKIGPKRQQGDGQVPEGFYEIASLQPASNYHLALRVNYPNKSDRILAGSKDPGGDIMIHGDCVTIGCIPIQDEPIEELYVLCLEAMSRGRKVRADIFPFRFTQANSQITNREGEVTTRSFWNDLKIGYDYFEGRHELPDVSVSLTGQYLIHDRK